MALFGQSVLLEAAARLSGIVISTAQNAREDEPGFKSTKDEVGDDAFTADTRRDHGRPTSRGQERRRLTRPRN